ncbi:hypothetical protein SLS60_002261 [Paraconiothyrium brasiliense]|uniref:Uncharacterized protein n=1 Tax=Paraconiothyrium brasiliense TaxID=300254 RepID=A0ABR3S1M8_9PLEO
MAYYVFESISNVAYFIEKTRRATDDATEYQLGKMKQNVDTYTSAKYIMKKLADRQKENSAIISAVTALMLLSTALLTAAPLFGEAALLGSSLVKHGAHLEEDAIKELGEINQIAGVVSNSFIGLTGALKDIRDNPHLSDDLVSLMSISWNELAHRATDSIASDVVDLMKGALNSQGQDLRQLIKSGQFVEADP